MAASSATTPKKAAAARFVAHAEVSMEMQEEYFEFRIRNFSTQPHGVGERILSPDFELCGHKWCVFVCPGGNKQDEAGWFSAFLYNRGDVITADYKFELFAGVPSADSVPIWSSGFYNKTFLAVGTQTDALFAQGKSEIWGFRKTLQRDDLINRAVDDTITVRVTVRIGRATTVQCAAAAVTRHPEPAHKTLIRDLGALLETGDGSDVVLRADGRDFKAHKAILSARSRVLRAMFGGRFKEGIRSTTSASASSTAAEAAASKEEGVVELEEVDAETLGRMLRFIYTGSVASSSSSSSAGDAAAGGGDEEGEGAGIGVSGWMRLLNAADRFNVGDLFEVAQWRLAEMLTTTTASSSSSSASTPTEQRQRNALECLGLATQLPVGAEALKTAALDVLVRDGVPDDAELPWEMSKEIMKHAKLIKPAAAPAAKPQSDEEEEEEEEEEEPAAKRRASAGRAGRRSRK